MSVSYDAWKANRVKLGRWRTQMEVEIVISFEGHGRVWLVDFMGDKFVWRSMSDAVKFANKISSEICDQRGWMSRVVVKGAK